MTSDAIEAVLAVIRGESGLSALNSVGIQVQIVEVGTERTITVRGAGLIKVSPRPVDLAKGLLAHRRHQDKLRDWAAFVLAASDLIDLEGVDQWPEGDEILSALWDASFAGKLTDSELRVVQALAENA